MLPDDKNLHTGKAYAALAQLHKSSQFNSVAAFCSEGCGVHNNSALARAGDHITRLDHRASLGLLPIHPAHTHMSLESFSESPQFLI